jgi:hypothetical protein
VDKALILATELKALRERVSALAAIPLPVKGDEGPRGLSGGAGKQGNKGDTGSSGKEGVKGPAGEKGKAGVSIVDAEVDMDGTLSFKLSDGSFIKTTTEVMGAQGPRGVPGAKGDQGEAGNDNDSIVYALLLGAP